MDLCHCLDPSIIIIITIITVTITATIIITNTATVTITIIKNKVLVCLLHVFTTCVFKPVESRCQ